MTDLVPYQPPANGWVELMKPAADLATQIAGTDFVPETYRRNPAAIAACILFGAELGVPPMQSLSKIDLVKGRPAPRAELARALALAAGHNLWVDESSNTRVTVSGHRRGSQHVMSCTWTMDDVKKAGLASNPTYAKYPRQMLLARASAELVRQVCPDVLGGITVFAEEAADLDDDTPTPIIATATAEPAKGNTRKRRTPAPSTATTTVEEADALLKEADDHVGDRTVYGDHHDFPIDDAPRTDTGDDLLDDTPTNAPSPALTRRVMAQFGDLGITERDDRLDLTSSILGRDVGSWKDVTADEALRVTDELERRIQGDPK